MICFVSPTKNMKPRNCTLEKTLPEFCVEAEELLEILRTYNDEDIMNIMKVNAKLALQNEQRFKEIQFDLQGNHAITSYDGLAFQSMHLDTWKETDFQYAQDHLRILSGFYGVVRPLDSIYPYRLEMQAKGLSERIDTLYSYWNDSLMRSMREVSRDSIYINLASKEYSQAVTPYLFDHERCINVDFYVMKEGKRKMLATAAKMARGNMVEYIIKNKIDEPEKLKQFHENGWVFQVEFSSDNDYSFIKM